MIRHTVLLSFDGADEATVDAVISELRALPPLIPQIQDYTVGRDLGLVEGNATVVVVGDFATIEDYEGYSAHPEHLRVVNDSIKPAATGLVRAQIEL